MADRSLDGEMTVMSVASLPGVTSPEEMLAGFGEERRRRAEIPQVFSSKGIEDMQVDVGVKEPFRLVFARCHFAHPASGVVPVTYADMGITLQSIDGEEYNAELHSGYQRGIGRDLNFILSRDELMPPSGWTCRKGDLLRFTWSNPSGARWGLTVGLAYI